MPEQGNGHAVGESASFSTISVVRTPHSIAAIGLDPWLSKELKRDFPNLELLEPGDLFSIPQAAVIIIGPRLADRRAASVLSSRGSEISCSTQHPSRYVILSATDDLTCFQKLVDRNQVFYLARGVLPIAQMKLIILAAVQCSAQDRSGNESCSDTLRDPLASQRVIEFNARLRMQTDLASVSALFAQCIPEFFPSAESQLFLYDRADDILWKTDSSSGKRVEESAATGIAGFVLRTGESAKSDRCGDDPRWDSSVDCLSAENHLLAEPLSVGGDVFGVAIVARNAGHFPPAEAQLFRSLARCAAVKAGELVTRQEVNQMMRQISSAKGSEIFRKEAIENYAQSSNQNGRLLETSPNWLRVAYWSLIVLLLAGATFACFARVDERVDGPLTIRARKKLTVVSREKGVVQDVEVAPGSTVNDGDVLFRYRDPHAEPVRAPVHGTLGELWISAGQLIQAGDQVVTITDQTAGFEMIALLPASEAKRLRPGMPVVMKFAGYRDASVTGQIERVGREVLRPQESARLLGRGDATALAIVVTSGVPRSESIAYADGMAGEAEVTLGSEPIILNFLPSLRRWVRH